MLFANKQASIKNSYQGDFKKVLCVCSGGILRSATAAVVLSQAPYNYNTRAAGLNKDLSLIAVDQFLLEWADEIVCMEYWQDTELCAMLKKYGLARKIIVLDIQSGSKYRDPVLVQAIKDKYDTEKGWLKKEGWLSLA